MSFKREGNDTGLLSNLRRRRIKELFTEDVPEDEAKLLCNGRFACLVCSHNPVFDTVNMLAVHRQGKKHIACEAEFLRKKKELQALIVKRKHEQYMKDGTTKIRQSASTSLGGISSSQPYDPRVKKAKLKPYDRKPRVDLLHSESDHLESPVSVSSDSSHSLSATVPHKHTHQLKNIFQSAQKQEPLIQPYVSHRRAGTSVCVSPNSDLAQKPLSSDNQSVKLTQKSIHPSTAFSSKSCGSDQTASKGSNTHLRKPSVAFLDASHANTSQRATSVKTDSSQCDADGTDLGVGTLGCERTGKSTANDLPKTAGVHSSGLSSSRGSRSGQDMGKKKLAEQYYNLSGSGWKKDWDGKWIRDEDAEFDSDEDPPDLP